MTIQVTYMGGVDERLVILERCWDGEQWANRQKIALVNGETAQLGGGLGVEHVLSEAAAGVTDRLVEGTPHAPLMSPTPHVDGHDRLTCIARVAELIRRGIDKRGGVYDGGAAPNLQTIIDLALLPADQLPDPGALDKQLAELEQAARS